MTEEHYAELLTCVQGGAQDVGFFSGAGISADEPGWMPTSWHFEMGCISALQAVAPLFAEQLQALQDGHSGASLGTATVPLESLLQFLKDACGEDALDVCDVYLSRVIGARPNLAHRFLGTWMLREYGPAVTVNIDHLIEDGTEFQRDDLERVVHADVHQFTSEPLHGHLYKLHGSVRDRQTLRMTLDRVTPSLPRSADELFRRFLQLRAVCFLGWAGADLDLRPLIISEAAERRCGTIFFLLHARDGDDEAALRKRNLKAFELIDATGALPIFSSASALAQRLGEDFFGWAPSVSAPRATQTHDVLIQRTGRHVEESIRHWGLSSKRLNALAGQVTGHIYMQVGLYERAHYTWAKVLGSNGLGDGVSRAALLRNMAHADFRLHRIRDSLKETGDALRESQTAADALGAAWALFGLGSVSTAWPMASAREFLLAGRSLTRAARTFAVIHQAAEKNSRRWREAMRGEASSMYWLARWRQRWLSMLIPHSRAFRDFLGRSYERAATLLEDEYINDVNELVNPFRSHALVLARGSPAELRRALILVDRAERLVRWTMDRQRVSTVLRNAAAVHEIIGTPEHLRWALDYWTEAVEIAGAPAHENQPPRSAGAVSTRDALNLVEKIRKEPSTYAPSDANGVGLGLYGMATTVSRMGSTDRAVAAGIARCGLAIVARTDLPGWSKLYRRSQLSLLLIKLRLSPPYARAWMSLQF